MRMALTMAITHSITAYDACYVTLAHQLRICTRNGGSATRAAFASDKLCRALDRKFCHTRPRIEPRKPEEIPTPDVPGVVPRRNLKKINPSFFAH
jgi:hypothetical protein